MMLDLVIVGGGLVGASLALALRTTGLSVGLIEARPLDAPSNPAFDGRAIALAQGSVQIFERLGIWPDLASKAAAIRAIHISDRGHFGITRLSADALRVPALGQVALARDIGAVMAMHLEKMLQNAAHPGPAEGHLRFRLLCPARLIGFQQQDEYLSLNLESETDQSQLHCRLLVAADGKESPIRKQLGIGLRSWGYDQSAITASVRTERPHNAVAYERFTDSGPLALLPMPDGRMALVWTCWDKDVERILALDDRQFLATLQERFGWRQGRFLEASPRASYPLAYLQAQKLVGDRIALIGNAAHLLHPIAGQGFNLGLRDVQLLARLLADVDTGDVGQAALLAGYAKQRLQDQRATGLFTDALVRTFSNDFPGLGPLRGLGLAALDRLPLAKTALAHSLMGLGANTVAGGLWRP